MFEKLGKFMANKKVRIIGTTILTGVGLFLTVRQAIKETPKVNYILEESKEQELSKVDTAKVVIKNRWKSIALGCATLIFVVAVVCADQKDIGKISSAYAMSEASIASFRKAVDDVVDPAIKQEINKKYVENQAEKHPIPQAVYVDNNGGKILFRESYSGETFYSTLQEVQDGINEMNREIATDGFEYSSLEDLLYHWGKTKCGTVCSEVGWSIEDGKITHDLVASEDGMGHLCWDIVLNPVPASGFNSYR